MRSWSFKEAIELINLLENHFNNKYHVALAGSILTKGFSEDDLDLWIYPHTLEQHSSGEIRELLESFGMKFKVDKNTVHSHWKKKGSTDSKHVEIWTYKGKKVDLFLPYGDSR